MFGSKASKDATASKDTKANKDTEASKGTKTTKSTKKTQPIRPVAVNIDQVKKDFSELAERFAIHAKDMANVNLLAFSHYAAKYDALQIRYENLQDLIKGADEPGNISRAYAGNDEDGKGYSDRFARRSLLVSEMQEYVTKMYELVDEFIPVR